MAFSYTVKFKIALPPDPATSGKAFWMGGSFTDCQAAGSAMALGTDHGATEIIWFHATNLTDTDEEVKVSISTSTVTIGVGTNDDDGTWEAIILEY